MRVVEEALGGQTSRAVWCSDVRQSPGVSACVDLLEDLAEIDDPPTREALAKKEHLIARIGALLAPRAEPALRSFVLHVVSLSQQHRAKP